MSRCLAFTLSLPLLGCGLVKVNGQPLGSGGSPGGGGMVSSSPAPTGSGPAVQTRGAAVLTVQAPLTSTPLIADIQGVALDATFSQTIGGMSPDCGSDMSGRPIAVIDVKQPSPAMVVTVAGGRNDGFVLKKGGSFWSACAQTISEVPAMGPPQEGWQPGRYEVYPVTRYYDAAKPATFEVSVADPTNPAPWSGQVQAIAIDQKLASPLVVEVKVRADRQVRREGISGSRCEEAAFAAEPDVALTVNRPIEGLSIRPLPTRSPVTLRREVQAPQRDRFCVTEAQGRGPSWRPDSEVSLAGKEGVFGLSVGLPAGADDTTVRLMIFDASTKFAPLTLVPFEGPRDLAHRALPWHFPQLDLGQVDLSTFASAELAATLFAAAPAALRVYPKVDLDDDLADGPRDITPFPRRDEPLLVLEVRGELATLLSQDGFRWTVPVKRLGESASGPEARLAAPRALPANYAFDRVSALLPPAAAGLAKASRAYADKHQACIDRVAAPFDRQMPRVVRPSNVDVVYIESARTRAIRDAATRAIDKQCGTRAQHEAGLDRHRVQMLAAIEKARVSLFATAGGK